MELKVRSTAPHALLLQFDIRANTLEIRAIKNSTIDATRLVVPITWGQKKSQSHEIVLHLLLFSSVLVVSLNHRHLHTLSFYSHVILHTVHPYCLKLTSTNVPIYIHTHHFLRHVTFNPPHNMPIPSLKYKI
jgi:hypothetical protein